MITGRSQFQGQRDLRAQHLLLDRSRGEVIMIVESDLADRQRAGGGQHVAHLGGGLAAPPGKSARAMRVNAGGKPDGRPRLRDASGAPNLLRFVG